MKKIMCSTPNCAEFVYDDGIVDYVDFLCTSCFEEEEMQFFYRFGWDDHMHTRMADAEMGDL